jgi:hypothetical protein
VAKKRTDVIFDRFDLKIDKTIESTKIQLCGLTKHIFGMKLENFPLMDFFNDKSSIVKAPGIVIGDNFSDSRTKGVFTSPYDKTAAKIMWDKFDENITMIFSGSELLLHRDNHYDPDLAGVKAPPDFYLTFAIKSRRKTY